MALKTLPTGQMIQISTPWVTSSTPQHKVLQSIPETRVVLPRVVTAHKLLLETQPTGDRASGVTKLIEEGKVIDGRHDDLARGLDGVVTGFAFIAEDPAVRATLLSLRDILLPKGLVIVNRPYREEAGEALLLKQRLDTNVRKQLAALPTPFGSLADVVDKWIAAGHKLGELEDRRVVAEQAAAMGPSAGDVLAQRNQWIRAVNALCSNLDLAEVDEETRTLILGPLRDAERRADLRAARRTTGGDDEPNGTGSSGEGTGTPA